MNVPRLMNIDMQERQTPQAI